MKQIKHKIEIVEYHEGLAAGVAEMWNLSREGWGGDSHVTTEEKVRIQEANSSNLNLYLAMDGDNVVGYCGLCEYREDEGALYIPLLNVRTDYHGRKIGKQLVLKALERAKELNWPRLDLYTWPGNTKAVPLYKKCGFFWEDRDDTTHLMNFMPTALNTEAVEEYFSSVDWYDASTRVIEVKPDGKKDQDFTYYEYKWDSNGEKLTMEFERTARGLRKIETNDYVLSVEVENFNLVCDSRYRVRYDIKNKSGKLLHIELKGEDHKNVTYSFEKSLTVENDTILESYFNLNALEEEQSNWRTHPSVVTNVLINGKKAKFAVGILPKLPAKISGFVPESQCFVSEDSIFYLDLENNFNESATFTLSLPMSELLELKKPSFNVTLASKGKVSLKVPYRLRKYGFYAPEIDVIVVRESGVKQHFTKKIGLGFKGLGARFYGECDHYWHLYNGLYHLYLSKFDNKLIPGRLTKGSQKTMGMFPKIGKPYSGELSKRKPNQVSYKVEDGATVLYATYESTDFPNFELVSVSTLYSEGLLEQSYIVRNKTLNKTEPVWIYQPIIHDLYKPVFALNGEITKVEDAALSDYGLWNSKDLSENWIFSRYESTAHGVTWPKDAKINFESWYMYVEHELGEIAANAEYMTNPVYFSIGAYQSWEEFRAFAIKQPLQKSPTFDDLVINQTDDSIKLMDRKASYIQGNVSFNNKDLTTLSVDDEKREVIAKIQKTNRPLSRVTVDFEINGIQDCKNKLLFHPSNLSILVDKETREGVEILVARNEELTIAASESFYPSLFSMKMNGKEWLDTSFPTLKPKSWWNPWSGGVRSAFQELNHKSYAKEKTMVCEGSLVDDTGRVWKGLKITTNFTEHDTYKGLGIHQYYCMLPGIPVIAAVTKINQNTGMYFHYKKWYTESCFTPGWIKSADSNRKYIAGKAELLTSLSDHVVIGSSNEKEFLQVITDREAYEVESYMNKEIMSMAIWREIQMENGTEQLSAPSFIVGIDRVLSTDEVKDLQRMTFKEVERT